MSQLSAAPLRAAPAVSSSSWLPCGTTPVFLCVSELNIPSSCSPAGRPPPSPGSHALAYFASSFLPHLTCSGLAHPSPSPTLARSLLKPVSVWDLTVSWSARCPCAKGSHLSPLASRCDRLGRADIM